MYSITIFRAKKAYKYCPIFVCICIKISGSHFLLKVVLIYVGCIDICNLTYFPTILLRIP